MKKILTILFLGISLASFGQRWVINPLSGEIEYVWNSYNSIDTLLNLGYSNQTYSSQTLFTAIGWSNYGADHSIGIGWNSRLGCEQNWVFGKRFDCWADKTIGLGFGNYGGGVNNKMSVNMPGSVGMGMFTRNAILHIHSGARPPSGFGEPSEWEVNTGGVRIGWKQGQYNDDSTALVICAARNSSDIRNNAPAAQYIATENDEWIVDLTSMTVAGTASLGNVDCTYVPHVYSGAADTSLLPTPPKIGDYYINYTARDVYISVGTARGKWKKVN